MPGFRFFHSIEVRYADLDPQGHVNNACHLTYCEQARVAYWQHLGLWDGKTFQELGFILAEARLSYKKPIHLNQPLQVGVTVTYLGNKSLRMEYRIEDNQTGDVFAEGSSVLVAFDYRLEQTVALPESWREAIQIFEDI